MKPGAISVAGVFTGPTGPSVLSEPRGPSAIDEPSIIVAELAEPNQKDEDLRRRNQELEQGDEELRQRYQELQKIVGEAVRGSVIVEKSGGGDHDQNAASSPFGRKERRFLIGAALALLLVVGVILGVVIPLTTKNDQNNNNSNKGSPSIDSVVTPTQSQSPTQSPTAAPTKAPTVAPAVCTSLLCLADILLQNEVAIAEALQDESSPQFQALHWLANEDTVVLDLDSSPSVVLVVERYVLAVLYFATNGEGWEQGNFLSSASVCEWNNVLCNEDDSVVALLLGKSKYEEVIVLLSKICIDSPVYLSFRLRHVLSA
jgi:hypothetical protein